MADRIRLNTTPAGVNATPRTAGESAGGCELPAMLDRRNVFARHFVNYNRLERLSIGIMWDDVLSDPSYKIANDIQAPNGDPLPFWHDSFFEQGLIWEPDEYLTSMVTPFSGRIRDNKPVMLRIEEAGFYQITLQLRWWLGTYPTDATVVNERAVITLNDDYTQSSSYQPTADVIIADEGMSMPGSQLSGQRTRRNITVQRTLEKGDRLSFWAQSAGLTTYWTRPEGEPIGADDLRNFGMVYGHVDVLRLFSLETET